MWRLRACPHCGGDMYLVDVTQCGVRVGEQWECLQCGRVGDSLKKQRVGGVGLESGAMEGYEVYQSFISDF